jgi:hypothetical protein
MSGQKEIASMTLRSLTLIVLAGAVAASCSTSPVSPTVTGTGSGQSVLAKGKPKPPSEPPPASVYSLAFTATDDPGGDGLPSPGHLELLGGDAEGAVGVSGSGFPQGTVTGAIAGLTITSVAELPDWYAEGDPCQEPDIDLLVQAGVVGSPVGGSLTLTFSEFTSRLGPGSPRATYPEIVWELTGAGGGWTIRAESGGSTEAFFPVYSSVGDTTVATVENSVIDFIGPSFSVFKCRVDYTVTLTKQSQ